jgi:hypothetical protein
MGHLTTEQLGRLVSEEPTPTEWEHLGSCRFCQAELQALKEQTEAMGALPDLRPPAGDWEALEGRLMSEGLIRSSGLALHAVRFRSSTWFQAAAAVVLFLGGTALGSRTMAANSGMGGTESGAPAGLELVPMAGQIQPASTLEEAAEYARQAELQYIYAMAQWRQLTEAQGDPLYVGDPAARLAALQGIVAAGQAAVQKAPADPFMNGVLVSALAEREAILRNASLTPGAEIF